MNWEAIGAIAELAGAVAVVATLVYLSIQIRHNSKLLDNQLLTSHHDALNEHFRDAYRVPGLSELVTRSGVTADGFTEGERTILHYRLVSYLNTMQVIYYRTKQGLIDPSLSQVADSLSGLTRSAFGRQWWQDVGNQWGSFSDEFIRHVDLVLDQTGDRFQGGSSYAHRILESDRELE